MTIEDDIRSEAMALGVNLFGISKIVQAPHFDTYINWVNEGKHASMKYLSRPDALEKRKSPQSILADAKSMIVMGFKYPNPVINEDDDDHFLRGKVSSYAVVSDYHQVLTQILKNLIGKINLITGHPFNHRLYTDTGPILERDFGQLTGLGWVGKNSLLISPYIGSFFFLSEILLSIPLQHTDPFEKDFCGTCTRCIESCPTACIGDNKTIDARKCISYLTIENKGAIPRTLRSSMKTWIFGCEICQDVCPWNRTHRESTFNPIFRVNNDWQNIALHDELLITDPIFKGKFENSPILRAKRTGFLRNILCALGVIKNPISISHLDHFLEQEKDIILREHAFWALGQIRTRRSKSLLEKWRAKETDLITLNEIELSLAEND